jgi:nucleotide-binding universal stress UspA family protein
MYLAVLVALDGSRAAAAAIPPALEIARAFVARLVLMRVVPGKEASHQRDYEAQRSQAEGYLDSLKRSLETSGVEVESVVGSGDPASVILDTARSLGRSLVVITAYSRKLPPSNRDLGHVARAILREAEGPVVFIRPRIEQQNRPQIEQVNR